MKRLLLIFTLLFTIAILRSQTYINNDTIWSSDTIKVFNDIIVAQNSLLEIYPGVHIEFQGNYSIKVYGKLKAIGTLNDSIVFTVNDTAFFADTSSYEGGWGSVKLLQNQIDTTVFRYCHFSYGKAVEPGVEPINNNNLNLKGGCILGENYHSIIISNSKFDNNRATYEGGAICCIEVDEVDINNNKFNLNKTLVWGGAISINTCYNVEIKNNTFTNNRAFKMTSYGSGTAMSGQGGALSITLSNQKVNIINNFFYNNKAISGIIYEANTNTKIKNNILTNNYGVALYNGRNYGNQSYYNNTVVYNSFPSGTVSGLMYGNEGLILKNNVFWNNLNDPAYPIRQEIECAGCDSQSADSQYNTMTYGAYGEGSIDDYPQFANPTEGAGMEYDGLSADWSLLEISPCINTGTPDTTGLNLPAFDITGNPRVFGGRIDMGAYENQSVYVKINESPVYSKINVYPNPGNNEIYIDIPPEINGSWIDIVDGQGKILMHEQINISPAMLSPYKLKSGIYYYRIYNENKVIKSGKWVKNAG